MDRQDIKKRYTRIRPAGNEFVVELMVVPQYFAVFKTDEGLDHAVHFQGMLATALERMQMEMVHDALNELGVE